MKLFPNLDGLLGLADRGDVDIRPTLLRVLTDLYVQKPTHSRQEEQHYTELALRLIEAVDQATRRTVAARLATYRQAPPAVIERLKRNAAGAATPAFDRTPAPGRHDAQTAPRGLGHPAAAAGRPDELSEAFFSASGAERRLILLNLEYVSAALPPAMPPAHAIDAIRHLERAALERDSAQFTGYLHRLLGLSREQTRRIVEDPSGEPIVVAAKALSMPAEILQRILLFLNPKIGHSVTRVYELSHLFDEITPQAAQHLVAIWRSAAPTTQRPAIHQPVHWDDEAGQRRSPATPIRRPADQTVRRDIKLRG
jgi:Uncharacterised protein conserved in bacteria (DUF2336)